MKLENKENLINKLADYEHDRWSRWQRHLFNKSIKNKDGSYTIPKDFVERWERQMNTSYADLSSEEQLSDIKEAKMVLQIIQENNK